jgi:hypothetical protein
VVHHRVAVMTTAVVVAAAVPTGVRAEDEAGEEDDGDDEDDTCHDADPGRDRAEAAMAWRFGRHGCWLGRRRRGDGAGRGFGGRRCFTHETDDASGANVPALNSI